jgi:DNA-binding NarL/FixJ family response regulator
VSAARLCKVTDILEPNQTLRNVMTNNFVASRKGHDARAQRKQARIFLVDDHPLVRERLTDVLNEAGLKVCGEAEDRHEALEALASALPDLVIADITLKNSDGLELIKDICARWPKMRVLVVSMHDESLYAERVIRAGAFGYITKQEATRNVLVAVRRVLEGNIYLNERTETQLISRLASPAPALVGTPVQLLADRELQVFELTGHGLNTRQIARRLHIGVKTAETYRTRIREKLGLAEPSDLLRLAISWVHNH